MERLGFENEKYNALEVSIHMNRYLLARNTVNGKKVLDVACGEGYGSKLLKTWGAASVDGVDISRKSIKTAKKMFKGKGITFHEGSAEKLEFPDAHFDLIISLETIEHLNDPLAYLNELRRVANKDATIIITCPNDYKYYPTADTGNKYHLRKYTEDEFIDLVVPVLGEPDHKMYGFFLNGWLNTDVLRHGGGMEDLYRYMESPGSYILPADNTALKDCVYFTAIWSSEPGESFQCGCYYPADNFYLDTLNKSAAQKDGKISALTWDLETKDKWISRLESEKKQLDDDIRTKNSYISKLEGSSELLADDLKVKSGYISELEHSKEALDKDIKAKSAYISDLEHSKDLLDRDIKAKSDYISDLEHSKDLLGRDILVKNSYISELEHSRELLDKDLKVKIDYIAELERSKELLNTDIKRKTGYISDLEHSGELLGKDIKVKESYISELERSKEIADKDVRLKSDYIAELERAKELLNMDIRRKNDYISGLERSKEALDEDIKNKTGYISELEQSKAVLAQDVKVKSGYIEELLNLKNILSGDLEKALAHTAELTAKQQAYEQDIAEKSETISSLERAAAQQESRVNKQTLLFKAAKTENEFFAHNMWMLNNKVSGYEQEIERLKARVEEYGKQIEAQAKEYGKQIDAEAEAYRKQIEEHRRGNEVLKERVGGLEWELNELLNSLAYRMGSKMRVFGRFVPNALIKKMKG